MAVPRAGAASAARGRCDIHVVVVGEFPVPGRAVAGGPANATARLVEAVVDAGVRVTVVAPAPRDEPGRSVEAWGAEVVFVPHDQRLMLPRRMRPWTTAALRVVESVRPDLIHGQGIITGGVVTARAARPLPRVVTARGNALRDTLAAYRGISGRARGALRDNLVRGVLATTDVVVNVHPDWRTNLPFEPRHSVYIPNIVDEAFFLVNRTPIAGRVVYCGGARRIKGHDVLEAAWPAVRREVPDALLRLIGWPATTPAPALDGVAAMGALGPQALAREMAEAALIVIPSRYEVAPILLAEAWAAEVPVVATDAGGMASLAPGAAMVVPSASPDALAHAMVEALHDSSRTAANVAEGRARAKRHRAAEVVAAHISLYDDLVRGA